MVFDNNIDNVLSLDVQADSEPEEALALIPSLSKFTEQDIKAILDIVHKAHAPR
jgi:hypothetical protein